MSRRLLATVAVLALTMTSALTLSSLVVTDLWLGRTVVVVAVATAVVALARTRTSSAVLGSLLGLVAGVLTTAAVYFPEEAVLGVLPTRATLQAVIDLVPTTVAEMRGSYPPIATGTGVPLLVSVGVLAVLLLAEMLAVGAWAPTWAGLPVLGLWTVPITLGVSVDVAVLVAAALSYVLLIAVQARDDAPRRPLDPRAVRATTVVAAGSVVVCLVLAGSLLRLPTPVRWHPYYELVGTSTTRLDLGLGLRDDLVQNNDTPLFWYTGASPATVGPLHAYTIEQFTGSEWDRGPTPDLVPVESELLWPESLDALDLGTTYDLQVTIDNLGQDRLLLPGEPRALTIDTDVDYAAVSDEVVAYVGDRVEYSLTVVPRQLDEETLRQAEIPTDVDQALLQIPETGYESDIAALTREVVDAAGASTPHEQVVAIQNYLRDPSLFVYSTTIAAPRTPDAVWDFLQDRSGYCVQFASAMVMMVRSLGIPARLAVGFLPGVEDSTGRVEVTADRGHAWPQVLFEGIGWVRFEPTPGIQAGTPPPYAPEPAESSEPSTSAAEEPSVTASTTAGSEETTTSAGAGAASGERETSGTSTWLLVLAALVFLGVAAASWARRAARLRGTDVWERWERVTAHLGRLGVDVSASRTPGAVAAAGEQVLDEDSAVALRRLAAAVETISYDRTEADRPADTELAAWEEQVLEGARAAQRAERAGV